MGSTKFHEKFNSSNNPEEEKLRSENKNSPQGFFITQRDRYSRMKKRVKSDQ